jgi:hypothetical protein
VISLSPRQLGVQLFELNGRRAEPVQRVQLARDPLRPPFMGKQIQRHPHRQGVVVQDRVQLASPLFVGGIIADLWKQITEAEETAHQRPATRSQKAESLPSPDTSDDRFGFILENHRLRGDSTHGSPWVTRPSGVPGLARPSKLLDCRRHLPAASKAAHVPTVAPSTACRSDHNLFGVASVFAITSRSCGRVMNPAPRCARQGYGCGATMTRSEVVDKITKAMQSSAPITTASVEMPPALTGASGG